MNPIICLIHHTDEAVSETTETSASSTKLNNCSVNLQVQVVSMLFFAHEYCKHTVSIIDDGVILKQGQPINYPTPEKSSDLSRKSLKTEKEKMRKSESKVTDVKEEMAQGTYPSCME